jgi:transcriptional regulator with XRE-family HTH domain
LICELAGYNNNSAEWCEDRTAPDRNRPTKEIEVANEQFTCNEEIWKPIPGLAGRFEASNLGRIRSVRVLKQAISYLGYPILSLCCEEEGIKITRTVHRMVYLAFHGTLNGLHVNHINGNKKDNRLSNLEAVTPSQNRIHALATGLSVPHSALNKEEVREIRKSQLPIRELAANYGVAKSTIFRVLTKEAWARLDPDWDDLSSKSFRRAWKLTPDQAREIVSSKESQSSLARKFNLAQSTISRIKHGIRRSFATGVIPGTVPRTPNSPSQTPSTTSPSTQTAAPPPPKKDSQGT